MKAILDDLLNTVKRLNKELDERTEFEAKLIQRITELETELSKFQYKETREDVKKELKTEKIIMDSLKTTPLIQTEAK